MMNRKEFMNYLEENIKDYLPESYADASVSFHEVVKNNDTHLTGMSIARPGDVVVPNIYIENFLNEYEEGRDLDEIVGAIADMRIEYDGADIGMDVTDKLSTYEAAKDSLQIRLCDTMENQDRLANLVHTEHSDFSAIYYVALAEGPTGGASIAVSNDLMNRWGVTVEQIHADALAADMNRGPVFCSMQEIMESLYYGNEPENLLGEGDKPDLSGFDMMFCLTNENKMNAAGLLLQEDLMQEISSIVDGNFYILPSSIHETLIVPESTNMDVRELSAMVHEINVTEVSAEDRLSDHVQFYDKDSRVMENAVNRADRMDKERAETKAAKRSSIHDRLGEKKQQSSAQKEGRSAEKVAEKAAKRNKGQEL